MNEPRLVATIDCSRGGKITSLRDVEGREWLTQARTPSHDFDPNDFVRAEMADGLSGDIVPTSAGCGTLLR